MLDELGKIARLQGQRHKAIQLLNKSLALYREAGDRLTSASMREKLLNVHSGIDLKQRRR